MLEWLDAIIEQKSAYTVYTIYDTFLLNMSLICLPRLLSNVLGNVKTCKLINSTSKHCDLNPKIPWEVETKSTSKNNFAPSNETQIFAPQIPTTFHLRTWKEIHILGFHLFQEKEREKETEKETERETERI